MLQNQLSGMQIELAHLLEPVSFMRGVFIIADNGVSGMLAVYTNLMGAAGQRLSLDKTGIGPGFQQPETGQ